MLMGENRICNTIYIELDNEIVKNNSDKVNKLIKKAIDKHSNLVLIYKNEMEIKDIIHQNLYNIFLINILTKEIKYKTISKMPFQTIKINSTNKTDIIKRIKSIANIKNILFVKEELESINGMLKIEDLNIMPAMINKSLNKDDYSLELAKFISKNNIEKIEKKYLKEFNKKLKIKLDSFNKIFDLQTGGIYFTDYELIKLKKTNKNHMLFSLFEADVFQNKLKYCYNVRDGIILRGPENYYFNMCYLSEYTKTEIDNICGKIIVFLKKAKEVISNQSIDIYNKIEDFKCVIAILDIVKNIATTELYYFLRKNIKDMSLIKIYEDIDNNIENKIYKLLKETYRLIYNIFFEEKKLIIEEKLKDILDYSIILEKEIKKNKNINLNDKNIRMWRETDYIIENIISIREAFKEILEENKNIKKENINIFGANYGSIDLAVLFEVIAETEGINNVKAGNVIINSTYDEIYSNKMISKIDTKDLIKTKYNILIDDNIVSGKSFESALYIIAQKIFAPICGIIIRPPQIGRINQMYTKRNNSRIDLELFNTYLKGLKGKAFFTKLCDDEKNETFLDGLEIFDEIKEKVRRELYKNKIYLNNSFVGSLKKD